MPDTLGYMANPRAPANPYSAPHMADIRASTFVLAVQDLEVSKRFYLNKLGFSEDFSVEGWTFLSRGACKLRLGHCPDAVPVSECQDHSWFAYLHVSDAQSLYREFTHAGVSIWHPLQDKPWGFREFRGRHP